jgi:hypothetical protein
MEAFMIVPVVPRVTSSKHPDLVPLDPKSVADCGFHRSAAQVVAWTDLRTNQRSRLIICTVTLGVMLTLSALSFLAGAAALGYAVWQTVVFSLAMFAVRVVDSRALTIARTEVERVAGTSFESVMAEGLALCAVDGINEQIHLLPMLLMPDHDMEEKIRRQRKRAEELIDACNRNARIRRAA